MLTLLVNDEEVWDDENEIFIPIKGTTLVLEHSLISLSKWESKWNRPFFGESKSDEETLDYIKCMTINKHVNDAVYLILSVENFLEINKYLDAPMTAAKFKTTKGETSKEVTTAELLYYLMIGYQIPMECQKWHLNRLIAMIKFCEKKNAPEKKMTDAERRSWMQQENDRRRQEYNTKG